MARARARVVAELDVGLSDPDVAVNEEVLDLLDAEPGLIEQRRRRGAKRVGGVAAPLRSVGLFEHRTRHAREVVHQGPIHRDLGDGACRELLRPR
jgi:hypothetical protein